LKEKKMAAGTIRVMTFPDGCVVETKLSQIPAGSLLAFNGDVLFRHYDDVTDRYMWTSGGGDRFTDAGLQEALSDDGALPVVLRYK
jgi:hypothetical protein